MKNTSIFAAAGAALLCAAAPACSFLDIDADVIPDKGYYDSEQKLLYGLAGIYGAMNSEQVYGNYYALQIANADDLCYYNNYNNGEARPDKYNYNAGTDVIYETWAKLYEGIKNANRYLGALETVDIDPSKMTHPKELYAAEARFLRAYYHFLLAQAWGDVPLRIEATVSPNPADVQLAATPQEQVLKWCADEIEASLPQLAPGKEGMPSRVSQNAAHGILARIYLFFAGESVKPLAALPKTEALRLAALHAKTVIDSGLHDVNPSYPQVFINMIQDKYDTEYGESMLEAEFLGDRSSASAWTNGRIGDLIGLKSQASTTNYSDWACNYSYGYYNGTYRLWNLYFTTDRTADEMPDLKQPGQIVITDARQEWNLPPYNYQGSNGRKINYKVDGTSYSEVLTIPASLYKTPWVYNNYFSLREIEGQDTSVENAFNMDNRLYDPTLMASVRNAGKWRRETVYEKQMTAKRLYTTINFPILRYADVLLMYAEAVNEYTGAPDELAKECVRKVRTRAGIATDEAALGDPETFRQLVRNERARELAFEGLRKWDLIRWGIFVQAMHGAGTEVPAENKYKNATILNYAAGIYAGVAERHVYLPVPTKEMGVNHAIQQNPLW